jgi:hypothetical protein
MQETRYYEKTGAYRRGFKPGIFDIQIGHEIFTQYFKISGDFVLRVFLYVYDFKYLISSIL